MTRLLEIAMELERVATHDQYFLQRGLYPNVDLLFWHCPASTWGERHSPGIFCEPAFFAEGAEQRLHMLAMVLYSQCRCSKPHPDWIAQLIVAVSLVCLSRAADSSLHVHRALCSGAYCGLGETLWLLRITISALH